jgi:hypothetical protein
VGEAADDTLGNAGGVTATGAAGGGGGTGLTEGEAAGARLAGVTVLPEVLKAASDEHPAITNKGRIRKPFIFFFMTTTPFNR